MGTTAAKQSKVGFEALAKICVLNSTMKTAMPHKKDYEKTQG